MISKVLDYLLQCVTTTFSQVFVLFGPLLILAFIMNYVAGSVERLSYRVFGKNIYLYTFGWLGTTVHELGHTIFALLFGHKITEIEFFTPNNGNSLGHVNHSYNPSNFFQSFGNFFIGIGPILLGSALLYVIIYYLFKINVNDISNTTITIETFSNILSFEKLVTNLWESFKQFISITLINYPQNWWKLLIMVYLLFSIGSSIKLSLPDIESAWSGFFVFLTTLFLFNLGTLWIGNFTMNTFKYVGVYFAGFNFIIAFSIILNIVFLILLSLIQILRK